MRLFHGTFAALPDLTDDEIRAQLAYAVANGWAIGIETTDDPHPRNTYWDMWAKPMFDLTDADAALAEVRRCREAFGDRYVRVSAYDASYGRQTTALAFLVHRPPVEPELRLEREDGPGRRAAYTLTARA